MRTGNVYLPSWYEIMLCIGYGKIAMPDITDATIEAIRRAVASINYGSVQITVHDGRVVQIEKSERIRLDQADRKTGSKAG